MLPPICAPTKAIYDHEVQRLQPSVAARIHEVNHADLVLHDVVDDVGLGKLSRRFLKERHDGVRVQNEVFIVHKFLLLFRSLQ